MKDTWIPHSPAIDKIIHGAFTEGELSLKIRDIYGNGIWNLDYLSFDLSDDLKATIKDYHIPYNSPKQDSMIWGPTSDGIFPTGSAYDLISKDNSSKNQTQGKQFEWIWKTKAPNKIRTFLWLFHHERLPTNHSLHQKGLNVNPSCHFGSSRKRTPITPSLTALLLLNSGET
ncbi:hypothetical protein MTR67_051814 [Solanum verrucosum]|uniref:Reverse transcriptase zinc-binding domain-containing protein n=1 Tax=Solanum verrucosum TaxID=315347 RepID=A0AAF1A324_SOLVR|nr:hypothetical protein MTR67_051814 [Solanum verrucosum]